MDEEITDLVYERKIGDERRQRHGLTINGTRAAGMTGMERDTSMAEGVPTYPRDDGLSE